MSVSLAMRRSDRACTNSVKVRAMGSGKASTPAEAAPSTAAGFQTWSHRFACGLARPQPAPVEAPPNHGSASMGRQTNTQAHTQHVRNAISAVPGNMLGRTSFKRAISACGSADASCATRKQRQPTARAGKGTRHPALGRSLTSALIVSPDQAHKGFTCVGCNRVLSTSPTGLVHDTRCRENPIAAKGGARRPQIEL